MSPPSRKFRPKYAPPSVTLGNVTAQISQRQHIVAANVSILIGTIEAPLIMQQPVVRRLPKVGVVACYVLPWLMSTGCSIASRPPPPCRTPARPDRPPDMDPGPHVCPTLTLTLLCNVDTGPRGPGALWTRGLVDPGPCAPGASWARDLVGVTTRHSYPLRTTLLPRIRRWTVSWVKPWVGSVVVWSGVIFCFLVGWVGSEQLWYILGWVGLNPASGGSDWVVKT